MSILEKNIERDNLIDGFFNKGYACDLDEVYEAVIGTIKDLEEANDNKIKQIDQLTNNWNELEKWLKEYLEQESNDEIDYAVDDTICLILNKMKELKEGK